MIPRTEALAAVLARARRRAPETVALADVAGRVLAEDLPADRDQPPFDASAMDGYAVRAADAVEPGAVLAVPVRIMAGDPRPERPVREGEAYQIMTGAPVPPGADAVVMVEHTEPAGEGSVRLTRAAREGAHIRLRGEARRAGDPLLSAGTVIGAPEIGLLATVGRVRVPVGARPRVGILSTGDEVVPPDTEPEAHQIRNSNGPMLAAQIARAGGTADPALLVGDSMGALREALAACEACDVIVAAGGVSMGEADLVGEAFREAGVEPVFHRVAMKPGKPLWFGHRGDTLVFGLPGNPVSALLGFALFVEPALRAMAGARDVEPPVRAVRLGEGLRALDDRDVFHPVRLERGAGDLPVAHRVRSTGSGDLAAIAEADAFALVPVGAAPPSAGDVLAAVPLPRR